MVRKLARARLSGQEEIIADIEAKAKRKFGANFREQFLLPADFGVAKEVAKTAERREMAISELQLDDYILDVGENFSNYTSQVIENAKTIVWNGTVGMAEFANFANGSAQVAAAISRATKNGAISIVGGGDTSAFAMNWAWENPDLAEFSLISTGGGAALELMSGNILPRLEALPDK